MKLVVTLLSIFSLTASAAPNRKVDAGVLEFKQQAAPSNPATGYNRFYVKADGKFYHLNALGVEVEVGAGGGDVTGPASSTDNAIARFDLATGKIIQNSVVTVGDTGIIAGATLPAASVSYTPTTPANWLSVPTQGQQALDNLAAQRPVINLMTEWQTFTPTIDNLGTVTGVVARKRRVGNNMEILVGANAGTPAASALAITIPDGLTVDTNVTKANVTGLGYAQGTFTTTTWSGTGITQTAFRDGATFTKIFFGYSGSGGSWNKGNGNDLTTTGNGFLMSLSIPIAEWAQATTVDIFAAGDYGPTSFTPTIAGFASLSNVTATHSRVGKYMYIDVAATVATPSATPLSIVIPNSLQIDTSVVRASRTQMGEARGLFTTSFYPNAGNVQDGFYDGSDDTKIFFGFSGSGGSYVKGNGNDLTTNGNSFNMTLRVPISTWSTFPIGVAGLVKRHWKGYFDKDCDSWTKATGLASDFPDDASCTFTQQKNQGMGTVTHTGAKTPGVTWTSTETGTIEVCVTNSGFTSGARNVSRWEIFDGTTSFDQVNTYGNDEYYPMKMCGIKDTTAGATETWKLRCEAPSTGSCSVNPAGSTLGSWTTFTIRYL